MVVLVNPETGQEWHVDNPIHIKRMLNAGYQEKSAEPKKKKAEKKTSAE